MTRLLLKIIDYFNVGDPTWTVRRRLVVGITLFACGVMAYVLYSGVPESYGDKIFGHMVYMILGINMIYVGGAVTDDSIKRKLNGSSLLPELDDKRAAK